MTKINPKQYHKNPRQITDKQFRKLQLSLDELGDLGGIVHNLPSNELVGGNQRSKAIDLSRCEIELVEQHEAPDEQGTVAIGFVIWKGKKYAYRQVSWDDETMEKANIVANKGGGTWDFDILANEFELQDLIEWGFEPFEFGGRDDANDPYAEWDGMPEYEQEDAMGALHTVKVHFAKLSDIEDFARLLDQTVNEKSTYVWHPKQDKEDLTKYSVQ